MGVWALSLTGFVCLLMALAVVDRIGFGTNGRSWLPWRRHQPTQAALSTGMDQVTALFYATKHYELEQRKTEYMLREESGDGAPRRFHLDLGGGEATLVVDAPRAPDHPEPGR